MTNDTLIARIETLDSVLNWDEIHAVVRALRPPTIYTLDELNGLPDGSVVRAQSIGDGTLAAFEKAGDWAWYETGVEQSQRPETIKLPATVLFEPSV